jgi:hypothetical protein
MLYIQWRGCEHRTFSAMSTVAHSSPVGKSASRDIYAASAAASSIEEPLRKLSSNYLDTHPGETATKRLLAATAARNGIAAG